ncbi:MAG TPA: hypothetical protein VI365_35125 [Trebonia sp.]
MEDYHQAAIRLAAALRNALLELRPASDGVTGVLKQWHRARGVLEALHRRLPVSVPGGPFKPGVRRV